MLWMMCYLTIPVAILRQFTCCARLQITAVFFTPLATVGARIISGYDVVTLEFVYLDV